MKKLLEIGNLYASESTWKDFALVKLCLLVFIVTYIPLMSKLIKIATQGGQEE